MDRTKYYLDRLASILNVPVEAFFEERPTIEIQPIDPKEASELLDVYCRVSNADERRRIIAFAKAVLSNSR